MAITTEKDPKTRKEYLLASGKVTGVFVNDVKEVKTYSGPNGPWTPTKRLAIVVDGTRVDLGMSEKEVIRAKDVEDKYHDVVKGIEVSVVIEENGEYKGATQYKAKTSAITILDLSGAETAPASNSARSTPAAQSFKPKDNTGIRTGHAVNGALNYFIGNGLEFDFEADGVTVRIAKLVNDVTETVVAAYKAKHPDLSEYDVGAAAGHAVLNATRIIGETPEAEFKDALLTTATAILENVIPAVTEYVKEGQKAPAAKVTKPAVKKAATKAKAVPKKVEETVVEETPSTGFDDLDDDIPF